MFQITVSNENEWTPKSNVCEILVSNRRLRPSPRFEYKAFGLSEDTEYRMYLKLETTDGNRYKFYKERGNWNPHSVAEEKEPILMQSCHGFQSGGFWNENGIQFKNLFLSTKEHKTATMVVESLRQMEASEKPY
uniref:T-box domain-containing protein n=1 Tax=Caenorhabditis tropicalis TaxID=1561998 RepID=A0A1I7T607_9PELO